MIFDIHAQSSPQRSENTVLLIKFVFDLSYYFPLNILAKPIT